MVFRIFSLCLPSIFLDNVILLCLLLHSFYCTCVHGQTNLCELCLGILGGISGAASEGRGGLGGRGRFSKESLDKTKYVNTVL